MLVLVHPADLDQLTHDLRLKARPFRFSVHFLDVLTEYALFLFEPLDALDKRFQLLTGDAADFGHDPLFPYSNAAPRRPLRR